MATIHLDETTTFMSEQSVAGLTDFGPGRSELFSRSAGTYPRCMTRVPVDKDLEKRSRPSRPRTAGR